MNPSLNEETYVTPCDVEAVNSQPTYPSTPTPTPACTAPNSVVRHLQNVVPGSVENGISFVWIV